VNAVEQLYRNSGLITEDNYIKVNDKLWVGPFRTESMYYIRDIGVAQDLTSSKELEEIISKKKEIIAIQESCGIPSLRQIFEDKYRNLWISDDIGERDSTRVTIRVTGVLHYHYLFNASEDWCILVRRMP